MMSKYLVRVNEKDEVIGKVSRSVAFKERVWHRGVLSFIFNSQGEIFVHMRTATKDIYPSYYDMCLGGGVDYGEGYDEAAVREVEEEIGAHGVSLTFLFPYRHEDKKNKSFIHVYKGVYDGPIRLEKRTMVSGGFYPVGKVQEMLKTEKFPPACIAAFEKYIREYHDTD